MAEVANQDKVQHTEAGPKSFRPEIGSWAILDQEAFACSDWDSFVKAQEIAASRDEVAFNRVMRRGCRRIKAGAVLWINDIAPLHNAYQVRANGTDQSYWMPRGYKFRPVF